MHDYPKTLRDNPDLKKELFDNLRKGLTQKDCCGLLGIQPPSFSEWKRQYPKFAKDVKSCELQCKGRCIDIIQKAMIKDWKAAAWWLERTQPAEYGRTIKLTTDDQEKADRDLKRIGKVFDAIKGLKK